MPRGRLLSHIQVCAQLLGVLVCCYPLEWTNQGSGMWLVFCAAGTATGIWSLLHNRIGNFSVYPEIKPEAKLVTSGPYRWVRHPMYASLIIMMLGVSGYNGRLFNLAGLIVVVIAVVTKAVREEGFMRERFPEYASYARRKARFIPFLV